MTYKPNFNAKMRKPYEILYREDSTQPWAIKRTFFNKHIRDADLALYRQEEAERESNKSNTGGVP